MKVRRDVKEEPHTITHTPVIRFFEKLGGASFIVEGKKLVRISLFAVGLYLLLPTPDEAFVHPLFGSILSRIFNLSFMQGVGISVATYTTIGIILCLIGGGKQIYQKIYQKLKTIFPGRYKISIGEKAI